MDGVAIPHAFGMNPGPDCLRDVVNKFGARVKVYVALKNFISSTSEVSTRQLELKHAYNIGL